MFMESMSLIINWAFKHSPKGHGLHRQIGVSAMADIYRSIPLLTLKVVSNDHVKYLNTTSASFHDEYNLSNTIASRSRFRKRRNGFQNVVSDDSNSTSELRVSGASDEKPRSTGRLSDL